ncbi:ABC transporter substrate-binding protein [Magnetospirillum sp. UT-4]|uniref:ABC transporter substrate-binding protein n=1 Tax=Magnetospirillum sp. UT-4 TaxID=2681467 RepID=UPI00137D6056|nr:ABC transporter substrate-binding protein [Magnetospirillum sp. UT-4]CAA7626088.1 ABC-type branched-chain amino acid transport system protein [Magnetospirillum sp. UT-4]
MKRLRHVLCALILALSPGAASALPAGSGASDPSIVIGIVATLTGPGAIGGQDLVDGFNLGLKQLGGRFGNQEVRVVVADDRGSPDTARQQVRRLLERERLDVVLTGVSLPAMAAIVKPLVSARLFVVGLDQMPTELAGAECSPWLFSVAPQADGVHEALGQLLAAERVRRLAVVGPDRPGTTEAVAALKRTFPGEVIAVLRPKPGATLFSAELAHIREQAPDAVYSLLTGGVGGAFVRAYAGSGLKVERPLYVPWQAVERPLLAAMGDAALDVVSIAAWSPDFDLPANRRLLGDFESEFGRPATSWVAQGFDAALLLDGALRATHGRTGDAETLRTALRRAEFASVRGGMRFNTNHFPVVTLVARKVVKDAKGRLTHETRTTVLKDWRDRHAAECPMRWAEEPAAAAAPVKKP